eukprot:6856326-Pyramimonas_sp.AAC.1
MVVHQPRSASPGPAAGSWSASGRRPRVRARVQAREGAFLAALEKRCRGAPPSPRSASRERPMACQERYTSKSSSASVS